MEQLIFDPVCRRENIEKSGSKPRYPVFHIMKRGSITIETALVLPLFLLAMFLIMDLFTLFGFYMEVDRALDIEGKRLAKNAFESWEYTEDGLCADIIAILKENRKHFPILGGEAGLNFTGSDLSERELAKIRIDYVFKPDFDIFGLIAINISQQCVLHTWIGYERGLYGDGAGNDEEVYVAKNGTVYHRSIMCSHIRLSISETTGDAVDTLRNVNGGKYKPCEQCHAKKSDGILYIAANGDRYHNSLSCGGLKRTIQTMGLSEALSKGLKPCSRCVGNGD